MSADLTKTEAPTESPAADTPQLSLDEAIDKAKRAFALKQYEQAVDFYATALEIQTQKHGDHSPENADLYFAYGKALLENAIAQSSVLGKEQTDGALRGGDADEPASSTNPGAFLSFSGDAEDELIPEGGEDVAVDLFAQAEKAVAAADAAGGGDEDEEDEDEDAEPEDDFNAAWEVLDLARALFDKRQEEDEEIKLKLADTYIALGDVSLETEKFEQAITDYETGLALKESLLPSSSRQLAEAHYKLGLVLDLTSGRLADAIVHVRRALDCTDARLTELRAGLAGEAPQVEEPKEDKKGKGKATGQRLVKDPVGAMSKSQIEAEIKDLEEVLQDLKLKLEELASPNDEVAAGAAAGTSAPELAAAALDKALNAPSAAAANTTPAPVNDLTGMVKKKKKEPAAPSTVTTNGAGKRKAEGDAAESSPTEKKVKLAEEGAAATAT